MSRPLRLGFYNDSQNSNPNPLGHWDLDKNLSGESYGALNISVINAIIFLKILPIYKFRLLPIVM